MVNIELSIDELNFLIKLLEIELECNINNHEAYSLLAKLKAQREIFS